MYRLLLTLVALIVAGVASHDLASDFDLWARQHNKVYSSAIEYTYRYAVYSANAERVEQLNAESNGGAVFALNNQFADLTATEFENQYLGSIQPENSTEKPQQLEIDGEQAVPDTYSWVAKDKTTPVKNQGQCGSCWAFSATENIESVWMITKGLTPASFQPLAPQQIVDCDKTDGGCNGGWPSNAFNYVKSAGGMDTESSYPYHAVNQACQFKPADVEARITGFKYATTTKNEQEIKTAVATVAPLSVCVDAQPWQFYSSGVMTAAQCGTSIDHCVQLTGYDTSANPPYWEVRNSWGASWGEKGFIRLQFGTDTCAVAQVVTTVTV